MMQRVRVMAASGSPKADVTRFLYVHFTSPSRSWLKEAVRNREESHIQIRNEATVMNKNMFGLSRADFFTQRMSSPTVP